MDFSDINIPSGERGIIIGTTRSGKSTLSKYCIEDWATRYPDSRTLVIDTKPHFKATHHASGIPIQFSRLYSAMRSGETIAYSMRLPIGDGTNWWRLENAWGLCRTFTPKNRGLVLIAQTNRLGDFGWLDHVIQTHYTMASKYWWLFTYVDEMMVFLRNRSLRNGVYQCIVSGGELGIGFLGATQRPRNIPPEAITEMSKLYMFWMNFEEDIDHLRDMGVPKNFAIPQEYYLFNYYDKLNRIIKMMKLKLPSASEEYEVSA